MAGPTLPQDDPQFDPIPITQEQGHPSFYNSRLGDELPTSFWDSLKAAAGLTIAELPTSKAIDYFNRSQLEQQDRQQGIPTLTAEEANRKYPEVDRPFTEPISSSVAEQLAREARDRHEMESIISRGPQDAASRGIRFGAGLAIGVLDPLSLAATTLTGGVSAGISALRGAEEAAVAGKSLFLQDLQHAAIGGLAAEVPNAYLTIQDQQDYSAAEALKNIAVFSAGFAGLKAGARFLVPRVRAYLADNPEADNSAAKVAVAQLASDKTPNVKPIIDDVINERRADNLPAPGQSPAVPSYEYSQAKSASDFAERDLYHGSQSSQGDFKTVDKSIIEQDYGHGIYLTDSPAVANGHAASKYSVADGKVFQLGLDENTNLLHLDSTLEGAAREAFAPFVEEAFGKDAETALKNSTGTQLLEEIRTRVEQGKIDPGVFDQLNSKLQAAGFDGTVREGGSVLGQKTAPHNIVMLFDPANSGDAEGKITERAQYLPSRDTIPSITPDSAQAILNDRMSQKTDLLYDDASAKRLESLIESTPKEIDIPKLQETSNDALSQLESLKNQGYLSEEDASVLDQIKELDRLAAEDQDMVSEAAACVGKDLL